MDDLAAMVVTVEPCRMGAGALLAARVQRLVHGAPDLNARACSSLLDDRRSSD